MCVLAAGLPLSLLPTSRQGRFQARQDTKCLLSSCPEIVQDFIFVGMNMYGDSRSNQFSLWLARTMA
jgi:hypothetical protein